MLRSSLFYIKRLCRFISSWISLSSWCSSSIEIKGGKHSHCHSGRKPPCTEKNRLTVSQLFTSTRFFLISHSLMPLMFAIYFLQCKSIFSLGRVIYLSQFRYGQANAVFLFCFWHPARRTPYRGRIFLARFHSIVSGSPQVTFLGWSTPALRRFSVNPCLPTF